jgi:hypothetical protein
VQAAWGGKNANCEVSILVLPSHECRFLTSPRVDLMALGGTVPACIQQPVHETWLVPRADGQRRLRWVEQQPDGTNRLMVVVPLPFKTERQPYAAGDVPYGSA